MVDGTNTADAMSVIEKEQDCDLRHEENRYAARGLITDALRGWFESHTFDQVKVILDEAGACWGPYQSVTEAVANDPRLSTESPLFDVIDQPGVGRYRAAGAMMDFAGVERVPVRPAPVLGQDTDQVLSEILGLSDGELGRLHDQGIIGNAVP